MIGLVAGVLFTLQAPGTASLQGTVHLPGVRTSEALVSLVPSSSSPLRIPPDGAPTDTAVIDQEGLRFLPAVVVIPPGAVVMFRNSDPVLHNVFSPPRIGADFNLGTYGQEEQRWQSFDTTGVFAILCHIHPEMAAYVVVTTATHVTGIDVQGAFHFEGIPPGAYTLTVWHPRGRRTSVPITLAAGERRILSLEVTRSGQP